MYPIGHWTAMAPGWEFLADVSVENGAFAQYLTSTGRVRSGDRVLDLGCGTGLLGAALLEAGARVTFLDPSVGMLDVARTKVREGDQAEFVCGAIGDQEMGCFDVVVSRMVLTHLDDHEKTFRDIRGVLKEGGLVVFFEYLTTEEYKGNCLHRGIDGEEEVRMLEKAGFQGASCHLFEGIDPMDTFHPSFPPVILEAKSGAVRG